LASQLVELKPDIIGLQELRHFFPPQARWIASRVSAQEQALSYEVHPTYKSGLSWFWEGIAILTRLPVVGRDRLRLEGQARVSNVVRLRLADGQLDFYNVHLASGLANEALRTRQARQLLDWMNSRAGVAQVLVGDFNSRPGAPTIALLSERLRSAHQAVHGAEPPRTIPTPLGGRSGTGVVIDYLFVNDRIEVHDAWVTFDRVEDKQPPVAASDHYGVAATISLRPPGGQDRP
jgi:endonuclease/exonuclease/phosphatase family metal-dependent hydrolase